MALVSLRTLRTCFRRVPLRSVVSNRDANAAIEFAFIAPALIVCVMGIVSYGGYFWLSHSIQQLANDSARAAVAGLTASERTSLAQSTLNAEIPTYSMLSSSLAAVTYQGDSQTFTISISYNASSMPFWATDKLFPMPSSTIVRSAAIKLGGY